MGSNESSFFIIDQYAEAVNISGFPTFACPGLHGYLLHKISQLVQPNSTILELGAGSGFMSMMLHDSGYEVTAIDIVADNFRATDNVSFICSDLNSDFCNNMNESLFDVILAVELIEHLENPRRFMRNCFNLLKPNGHLIITTPNIENPISKAMFLKDGVFQWFTDSDYKKEGHILPISRWLIDKIAQECCFNSIHFESFGNPFRFTIKKHKLFAAKILAYFFCNNSLSGEILIAMARK